MPKFSGQVFVTRTYELPLVVAEDSDSAERFFRDSWELAEPTSTHVEVHAELVVGSEDEPGPGPDEPKSDNGISDTTIDDILGRDK